MLGVWLAKGGRKKVEINKNSTNHSLNQAWNQSNINRIGQSFNFPACRLGKTTKKIGYKMGPYFEKVGCMVKQINRKETQQATEHHKTGLLKIITKT